MKYPTMNSRIGIPYFKKTYQKNKKNIAIRVGISFIGLTPRLSNASYRLLTSIDIEMTPHNRFITRLSVDLEKREY